MQEVPGSHNCSFNKGWYKLSLTQICAKKENIFSLLL